MKITKRQLKKIIKEVGEFSKMMFDKRIDVTYDGYYVDNVYFPYDRNNPETFRFLDLYTWVDEYYPELLNAHKNVSFDKKEMMKNYYSLIFAPDRRGVNMNYQLMDRIEKRNEANEFLSFLLEQIKRGIMMTVKESRQRRNFILESAAESLLGLPRNPSPHDVHKSVMNWMSMHQDPSADPDAGLVDSVIANVMVKNQIRKDDEHIGSKLNMLRRILDPDKARRQSYRQGIESEMRELDPSGQKQKYEYQTPRSLRMGESRMKITKRQLKRIIREATESFEPLEDFGGGYEKSAASSKDRMPDENVITMLLSTIALRMINGPESKAGYDLYNALMQELSNNGYSTDIDDLLSTLDN